MARLDLTSPCPIPLCNSRWLLHSPNPSGGFFKIVAYATYPNMFRLRAMYTWGDPFLAESPSIPVVGQIPLSRSTTVSGRTIDRQLWYRRDTHWSPRHAGQVTAPCDPLPLPLDPSPIPRLSVISFSVLTWMGCAVVVGLCGGARARARAHARGEWVGSVTQASSWMTSSWRTTRRWTTWRTSSPCLTFTRPPSCTPCAGEDFFLPPLFS